MINETIFHGLIEALSRGESLQSAMFSFYNAGYNKQEIEGAARELYKQTGGQAEKVINPSKIPQEIEKSIVAKEVQDKSLEYSEKPVVPETYLKPKISPEYEEQPEIKKEIKKKEEKEKKPGFFSRLKSKFKSKPKEEQEIKPVKEIEKPKTKLKPISQPKPEPKPEPEPEFIEEIEKPEIKPEPKPQPKPQPKSVQIVSTSREPDESVEDLNNRIESAISTLRNIRLPSKIEIINLEAERKPASTIQRVSNYGSKDPSNQAGQGIIILLILLFIFFLGALISVFVFKDQLIELFTAWNLA
ncbi:MAG TPA: hypothetical protein PK357_02295 [Candidatus Pacearchaeota archaeon]|nr:hypothetical protein [Candidatus Pacearchaeota archaeon]